MLYRGLGLLAGNCNLVANGSSVDRQVGDMIERRDKFTPTHCLSDTINTPELFVMVMAQYEW